MIYSDSNNLTLDQLDKITGGVVGRGVSCNYKMKSFVGEGEPREKQALAVVKNRTWLDKLNDYGDAIALCIGLVGTLGISIIEVAGVNGDNS